MKSPMAKKAVKSRSWTKEDVQMLKTLVREKTKTSVISRKLKRSLTATRQKAYALGVKLVGNLSTAKKGMVRRSSKPSIRSDGYRQAR